MKREDKPIRANEKFVEDLDDIKVARLNNQLERKMISNCELTRMARNTSVWPKMLKELSTIPRRKRHA